LPTEYCWQLFFVKVRRLSWFRLSFFLSQQMP
jgi:hypothetical protein